MNTLQKAESAVSPCRTALQRAGRGWLPRTLRKILLASPVVAALLGSGCQLRQWAHNGFKVGPNYSKPSAPVASEWIDYKDARVKSEEKDLSEWWHVFEDKFLNSLMDTAYQQNITLREAGARILQARAARGVTVGNLFPQQQQAFGDLTRNKLSGEVANPPSDQFFKDIATGFNASWELDFWGRFRRAVEAADAELDAAIEDYDDVLVILLSDVATNYTQLRIFQERLRIAWLNVVSQYNAYHLTADKFILGAATERDVQQAKQILEQTRARIPDLETGIRLANNQICILLGMPPRELSELEVGTYEAALMPLKQLASNRVTAIEKAIDKFTKDKVKPAEDLPGLLDVEKDPKVANLLVPLQPKPRMPVTPTEVVVGIPADLLRRRPDVRRAERQVAAQSARIGIARSDFYPHLFINGTIGVEAERFNDLFRSPSSLIGSFGPSFRWDVLNYGRILNNVRFQDARFQELAYTYQNTVLVAGREAEDSIVGFLKAQETTDRFAASATAAKRTYDISYDQYRLGAIDFTPVVLFASTLAEQQDQEVVSRGNIALNLIAIYRSLGGGWEMRLSRDGVVEHGKGKHFAFEESPPLPEGAMQAEAPPMPQRGRGVLRKLVPFKVSPAAPAEPLPMPVTAPTAPAEPSAMPIMAPTAPAEPLAMPIMAPKAPSLLPATVDSQEISPVELSGPQLGTGRMP